MRLATFAAVLSVLAMPCFAQSGPPGGGPPGGGRRGPPGGQGGPGGAPRPVKPVKRTQLDKAVTEMFRAADTNRDGIVGLAELQATIDKRRDARIRERFDRIDTDHNGALSQAEFFAWQHGLGSVASSEHQAIADIGGPVSETIAPDLGDSAEDRMLARLIEPLSATVVVTANTNYDTGMSLDELLAFERKRFDAADADHDGELSAEEQRSLMPQRGHGGPPGFGGPPPGGGEPGCRPGGDC